MLNDQREKRYTFIIFVIHIKKKLNDKNSRPDQTKEVR